MNLTWDPVTIGQCGGPTEVVAYVLLALWIRVAGYTSEGEVLYAIAPAWDPIYSVQETRINFTFPDPPPNGVDFFRVAAVDNYGQTSDAVAVCR